MCCAALLGRTADISASSAFRGGRFAAAAPGWPRASFRVDAASPSLFQPHLNTAFTVRSTAGTSLPLVLARVTERPLTCGVEQFSLSFHAPPGLPLPDGTHAFQHPALGAFDLFISPVGGGSAQCTEYEACFSRYPSARDSAAHSRHHAAGLGDDATC
jgi:hypothetical protein